MSLADLPKFDLSSQLASAARASANGHVVITKPTVRWPFMTQPGDGRKDGAGGLLIVLASVLLLALAVAMGIVSWHAQFAFVFAIKHQRLAAALEALGLDAGAVIFSVLGIALARLGRRAVIERVLVCVCAGGSAAMNAAGADLGSPRSVAAYLMPPVLFAITSDRLIAVIRRSALGPKADTESQRSAWRTGGIAALYMLRLVAAPPSTVKGARRALLNATPLPELAAADQPKAITAPKSAAIRRARKPQGRGRKSGQTKTARFLAQVAEVHGPLESFPLEKVGPVCGELAPGADLDPGAARTALRKAVLAAQDGGAK